jgi:hypothetical protein
MKLKVCIEESLAIDKYCFNFPKDDQKAQYAKDFAKQLKRYLLEGFTEPNTINKIGYLAPKELIESKPLVVYRIWKFTPTRALRLACEDSFKIKLKGRPAYSATLDNILKMKSLKENILETILDCIHDGTIVIVSKVKTHKYINLVKSVEWLISNYGGDKPEVVPVSNARKTKKVNSTPDTVSLDESAVKILEKEKEVIVLDKVEWMKNSVVAIGCYNCDNQSANLLPPNLNSVKISFDLAEDIDKNMIKSEREFRNKNNPVKLIKSLTLREKKELEEMQRQRDF